MNFPKLYKVYSIVFFKCCLRYVHEYLKVKQWNMRPLELVELDKWQPVLFLSMITCKAGWFVNLANTKMYIA